MVQCSRNPFKISDFVTGEVIIAQKIPKNKGWAETHPVKYRLIIQWKPGIAHESLSVPLHRRQPSGRCEAGEWTREPQA